MNKVIYCVILSLLLSGCVFNKKPVAKDPCANAPKECWVGSGQVGVDPSTVPVCVELIKCYSWTMTAND